MNLLNVSFSTMEAALDNIEKRIERLNRIVGQPQDENASSVPVENLTDALMSANTLIASALSGRETINKVVERADELENYLNPDFLDQQQELSTKEVYINTVAPELAETFDTLAEIKKLEPTLGAEYFRTMPDVTDKLKAMNDAGRKVKTDNEMLEETLTLVMQRYDEIQTNLKDSLKTMGDRIAQMEDKLQKKKQPDVDI